MRVKICGITSLEDAMIAVDEGADAVGFNFYQRSPRFIRPDVAFSIIEKLPPFVEKVGVFVNSDAKYINKAIAVSGVTLAQMHFEATQALYGSLVVPPLRVVRAQREADIDYLADQYRLLDAFSDTYAGDTNRVDLGWCEGRDCSKIILSGGLTPENVEAVQPYGFFGVDVCSGVERELGKKDPDKIGAFIRAAKQC